MIFNVIFSYQQDIELCEVFFLMESWFIFFPIFKCKCIFKMFTVLCWFLLCDDANQPWLYVQLLHPWLPFLPSSYPHRSSQSARLGSVCCTARSRQPSVLQLIVCICWCYFLFLFHSVPSPLCPHVQNTYKLL